MPEAIGKTSPLYVPHYGHSPFNYYFINIDKDMDQQVIQFSSLSCDCMNTYFKKVDVFNTRMLLAFMFCHGIVLLGLLYVELFRR